MYQECIEWEPNEAHLTLRVEQPDRSLTELVVEGEQHLLPVTKLGPAGGVGVVRRGDGDFLEHQGEKHADVGVLFDQIPELADGGVTHSTGDVLFLAVIADSFDCAPEEAMPGGRVAGHPSSEAVFDVGAVGFEVGVDSCSPDAEVDGEGRHCLCWGVC